MLQRLNQRRYFEGFLLYLPTLLILFAVGLLPTLYAVWLSFQKVTISNLNNPIFYGLGNYSRVLGESQFWYSLRWTVRFAALTTTFELIAGLALAVLFNRPFPGKGIAISLLLLPMMISPALIGTMIRLQLNEFVGPVALLMRQIGIESTGLLTTDKVQYTLIVIDVMQQTPFIFLIMYAAVQGVSDEILEAALVDGATHWQRFWSVTFPMITPFLRIAGLLRLIDSFLVFALIYPLTGGGPGIQTQSINIYIYNKVFIHSNYGQAGAAAVILVILLIGPAIFIAQKLGKEVTA